jgi:peroxiredoxin
MRRCQMAATSTMLPLGTAAPDFALEATDGSKVSLADLAGAEGYLVMFLCNHCPYVRHIEQELGPLAREYAERGIAVVGIAPNDTTAYPDDAAPGLEEQRQRAGWTFPYLLDETQEVAKAYRAACTPDLYVFDADRKLTYRGQFDDSRPRQDTPVTGKDLRAALDAVLEKKPPLEDQQSSIGCSIKWKPGNEPDYLG